MEKIIDITGKFIVDKAAVAWNYKDSLESLVYKALKDDLGLTDDSLGKEVYGNIKIILNVDKSDIKVIDTDKMTTDEFLKSLEECVKEN